MRTIPLVVVALVGGALAFAVTGRAVMVAVGFVVGVALAFALVRLRR